MAETLSHHKTRTLDKGQPMSLKILQTHVISAAVCARELYSASVEDRATVLCFLAL